MSEWQEFRLGDLTDWSSGGTPSKKKEEYWNGDIPWISASSMKGSRFFDSNLKITDAGLNAGSRLTPKDSILLLVRGSMLHQRVPVGISLLPLSFNQDVKAIRIKDKFLQQDTIDPWFLLYWFITKEKDLLGIVENTGIGAGKFDTKQLQDLIVRIPPKHSKDYFTSTAKNIDDKIENNRKINETLEGVAQAVFKSWFVDFEPTRAKMAALEAGGSEEEATLAAMTAISGKDKTALELMRSASPDTYEDLKSTANLFPASLQDSELGQIPDGWEVATLKDVTTEIRRGISPKYTDDGGVCVINQKCIRGHTINFSPARRNDPEKRKIDGREIKIGDVLVNSTGVGTLGRLAPVRHLPETTVFDSHVTIVRADTDKITKSFLISLMITKESYIEASGAGSTGQTELRKQILEEVSICKPDEHLLKYFEQIVWPCHAKIAVLEQENQTLTQTRDALLPKLLSGEIDVSDVADEMKEEVI